LVGAGYNSGGYIPISWTSVNIVGQSSAIAVSGSFDTKSPIASYPNWATQIQALWIEYRVVKLTMTVKPVANLALANVFMGPGYMAQYAGSAPSTTATSISYLPWHKLNVFTDRPFSCTWYPRDDPDQFQMLTTTTGLVTGGIVYNFSSTTSASENVVWSIFDFHAVLQVRGRRI